MLPELPDAKIETRKPIVRSSTSPCNFASKQIFRMMAERWRGVNGVQLKTTLAGQAGTVEGEAVEGAEGGDGDQSGLKISLCEGLEFFAGDGFDPGEDFIERIEASEIQRLASHIGHPGAGRLERAHHRPFYV